MEFYWTGHTHHHGAGIMVGRKRPLIFHSVYPEFTAHPVCVLVLGAEEKEKRRDRGRGGRVERLHRRKEGATNVSVKAEGTPKVVAFKQAVYGERLLKSVFERGRRSRVRVPYGRSGAVSAEAPYLKIKAGSNPSPVSLGDEGDASRALSPARHSCGIVPPVPVLNLIFLIVSMYKMLKHTTSLKPDSSRMENIK
ncbi:hypothetical protein JZ751_014169 [Albula glossodonta]|uniref:Uncharacterized protein n=1 Tax=Albula glossodonta TaxID=121402 RepID=A0A8T2NVA8_9TELE|nr:hypothetical protein JZ751_014169 [Albula glossodonta]